MADGPDLSQQLLQMQSLINSSRQSGGGKQGPLDGAILKGAQSVTIAHGGGGFALTNFGVKGSGRGMFGSGGDKLHSVLANMGDAFLKSISGPTGIQAPQVGDTSGFLGHGLGRMSSGTGDIEIG